MVNESTNLWLIRKLSKFMWMVEVPLMSRYHNRHCVMECLFFSHFNHGIGDRSS